MVTVFFIMLVNRLLLLTAVRRKLKAQTARCRTPLALDTGIGHVHVYVYVYVYVYRHVHRQVYRDVGSKQAVDSPSVP